MNGKTLFIMVLLLSAFLYPVLVNITYNVILPAISNIKHTALNIGGVSLLGGGGGDEIDPEWYPT